MIQIIIQLLFSSIFFSSVLFSVDMHICTECHGKKFEKSAMNISRIVKDMSEDQLRNALKGYREDSHGGLMKDIMREQLLGFTDEEISSIMKDILDGNITESLNSNREESQEEIEVNLSVCFSCHGENFEKHGMGLSRIVANMSIADLKASLHGYKEGTYGGDMKSLMERQVIDLSDEELDAMSEEIFKEFFYE